MTLSADHLIRAWIVAHRFRPLDAVMLALSTIGRGGLVWVIIGAALTATRRMRAAPLLTLALALLMTTLVADHLIKPMVERTRPFTAIPQVVVIGPRPKDSSFPSGHAANGFAGAMVLARYVPAAQIGWWGFAAAIAYSRVYLGVHYPLDVTAGAIVGVFCAALAIALGEQHERWWRQRAAPSTPRASI